MAINVFVPKFHTDEILEEIRECLEKGWTGLGFKTVEFENKWKEYSGVKNAHFVNSNTSGLHLAVHIFKKVNDWNDGDEIITTPLTFVSTNHAILYERLHPVFADVDQYLCLDPVSVKNRITSKTRAIMYVGIGGNIGQYEEILKICKENNLKLILDAAHMAGTKWKGSHVGPEADVAVFSFQAVKNLPTADSGMICFQNDELDKLARQLSWLGISKDTYQRFNTKEGSYKWYYDVPNVGFKYHGNSIVASIGLVQLKYLDEDNQLRNDLANYYINRLRNFKSINIIPVANDCYSSRHLFQVYTDNRDDKIERLYSLGIYPGVHYIDNTNYDSYRYAKGTCPKAQFFSEHILSLPLHLNITKADIDIIIDGLK
ncbi:MAG TPA: DegT/DnrJ/EryC1/StrS family aminotransferase [Bacteroidales bacterium]|nr:DegT/DnrJ/EryC1/StrS family aminotransferase [Bacteroidales bacterium]